MDHLRVSMLITSRMDLIRTDMKQFKETGDTDLEGLTVGLFSHQ